MSEEKTNGDYGNRLLERSGAGEKTYSQVMSEALGLLETGPLNLAEVSTLVGAESTYCKAQQEEARREMEQYSRQPDRAIEAGVRWAALGRQKGGLLRASREAHYRKPPTERPGLYTYLRNLDTRVNWHQEGAHSDSGKETAGKVRENIDATIQTICPFQAKR